MGSEVFVADNRLLDALKIAFSAATTFKIAMALISTEGAELLRDSLSACLARGGRGQVLFGVDLPTSPEAIELLLGISRAYPGRLVVRRFASPPSRSLHGKFYVFGDRRPLAFVGSSNLTNGGMCRNYEADVSLDDTASTQSLADYFEQLFDGVYAHDVTPHWLANYRAMWVERKANRDQAKRLRDQARTLEDRKTLARLPTRIEGGHFVFTGRIADWPRQRRLYPAVRRLGGRVGEKQSALGSGACLVQGELLGRADETVKLARARELNSPRITAMLGTRLSGSSGTGGSCCTRAAW